MPPLEQWNPILVRFCEQTPQLHISLSTQTEIAEILGESKQYVSDLMRGQEMKQAKIINVIHTLEKMGVSADRIIYVIRGGGLSDSGAWRLLHEIEEAEGKNSG